MSTTMNEMLFKVEKEAELRFEVEEGWTVKVQLISGSAELFGVACALNRAYHLSVGKYAVFSWYGCEVLLTGVPTIPGGAGSNNSNGPTSNAYCKDASLNMLCLMNVHIKLEHDREVAAAAAGSGKGAASAGPVTMIVGPSDTGKSTTARTLCAYAARRGKHPFLVDLDPKQNELALPGCIAATACEGGNVTVEHGVSLRSGHGLVHFFGYLTPSDAPEAYKRVVDEMALALEQRGAQNASGTIINTSGSVEGLGYALLLHAIETFKPSLILVMGQDLLQSKLKKDVSVPQCEIVKIPVSGGATTRNQDFRKRDRNARIREYFYGSQGTLTSSAIELSFDQVQVVRVPDKDDATPSAMRPVGKASALDPNLPRPVDMVPTVLRHAILAVSYAEEENKVLSTNVAGFLHVQSVDVANRTLTVLSPQKASQLPGKFLLMGGIKWIDGEGK